MQLERSFISCITEAIVTQTRDDQKLTFVSPVLLNLLIIVLTVLHGYSNLFATSAFEWPQKTTMSTIFSRMELLGSQGLRTSV